MLLAIECLDELVFGAREVAWPLIRADLHLTYGQLGLVLSVPGFVASLVEPVLGILGDTWNRRILIVGGGIAFTLSLAVIAAGQSLTVLLLASCVLYPASGAFVSLSQATLMDLEPAKHERNMARWTFTGSVGAVAGPLLLGALIALGAGWRGTFVVLAVPALLMSLCAARLPRHGHGAEEESSGFRAGLRAAWRALRRVEVMRWALLLQASDLMLDVLLGFLALYFVDVARASPAEAGLAVAVWTAAGLVGGLMVIPLLERVPGLLYLRLSVLASLALFPAFLIVPGVAPKLALLATLGCVNAGWYPVLQGRLYTSMQGMSGTALAVSNVTGFAGSFVPLALGLVAQRAGLTAAMWCMVLAPLVLLLGAPRPKRAAGEAEALRPPEADRE